MLLSPRPPPPQLARLYLSPVYLLADRGKDGTVPKSAEQQVHIVHIVICFGLDSSAGPVSESVTRSLADFRLG